MSASEQAPHNLATAGGGAADVACTHCGLPVPRGLVEPGQAEQFCCSGCRTVYAMIHGCGLDRYYRLRAATSGAGQSEPGRTTDREYSEFADPVFRELYYQTREAGTYSVELYLEGVHCAACVWLVEKLPQVTPGVIEARLDLRRSLVRIHWDDSVVKLSQVARTLDSLGYPPHPAKDVRSRSLRRQEDQRFLIRIGVAGACTGNVMTLAFALYGGLFTGIEAQYSNLFRVSSMLFGLIALAWPGNLFFRGAWAALRTRTAHLDLPIALGLGAGGLAGTVNAIRGAGEIYFDSLTMLIFVLLVGRWIQRRQQRWANDALELLFSLTPNSARRIEPQGIREVPLEAIVPGDLIEVRAGDSVATDGQILEGESTVDQSLLTGESRPLAVGPGDSVHAGIVNLAARLVVRVEAVGDRTRVGKLLSLVEECARSRAPLVRFADRIAGWFVLVVVLLAAVTAALWVWLDSSKALDYAIAMLIVTCPCALGLTTPLAITVAIGRAARRRILIKGGEALERLSQRGTIVLDKTGTITAGRTAVVSWIGDSGLQELVAALEAHSAHPVARAFVAAYGSIKQAVAAAEAPVVANVQQTTGGGLSGTVAGRRLVVGSPSFVRSQTVGWSAEMVAAEVTTVAAGATPVAIAVSGQVVALAGLADPIREDASEAVTQLQALGWEVRILSGDHPELVAAVAHRLGIADSAARGGATPEDKVAYIQELGRQTRVIMVGDGVNDAAALSAATVGIAVHGGAEASLAAADVYLNRPGLRPIVDLLRASRNTVRAIRRALAASLFYNAAAAGLTLAGLISPLLAAILMPLSSFTVLAMAFTARTFGDRT